jgi:hypothetical protein
MCVCVYVCVCVCLPTNLLALLYLQNACSILSHTTQYKQLVIGRLWRRKPSFPSAGFRVAKDFSFDLFLSPQTSFPSAGLRVVREIE